MFEDKALLVADSAHDAIHKLCHMATAKTDYRQMVENARVQADRCEGVLKQYLQLLSE
jgi:hypothetical protein